MTNLKEHAPALALAAVILIAALLAPRFLQGTHRFAPKVENKQLALFRHDCVDSALASHVVLPGCATFAAIKSTYHIDARLRLVAEQGEMISTARRIAHGEIYDRKTYEACLDSGDCATVPVLDGVDPASAEGKADNAELWHLINQGSITAKDCSLIDLCRALVKTGLIPQPPELKAAP